MIKKIKIALVIGLVIATIYFVKLLVTNHISSVDELQLLMDNYGVWGPLALTVIQVMQVVIPILPGYLGCAVGAISYGPAVGFICNYIGISVGSIIAFFLARHYGVSLVIEIFSENTFNKWRSKIESKKSYEWFLFMAMLLPLFPDDFLCYFSGLIGMDKRKFIWIVILGKPWCILAYSIIFGLI